MKIKDYSLLIALCVFAYLLGRIHFSVYVAKIKKIDLYNEGSKNPGASNVIRLAGWKFGILAILLDILKGFLPTLISMIIFKNNHLISLLVGFCSVMGHSFPITKKGGKGVATTAGGMLAIYPIPMLIALVIWVGITKIKKLPAVASLSSATIFVVYILFYEKNIWTKIIIIVCYFLLWIRHIPNLIRLIKNQENKT